MHLSSPLPSSGTERPDLKHARRSPSAWDSLFRDVVESSKSRSPLSGLRVIELAQILAGPYAATMLGDLGADVIKVEPPSGDQIRGTDSLLQGGASSYFASVNRNKVYLELDLQVPSDRAEFNELVTNADVFITNLRPSALVKLGITYEVLRDINENLVYCDISAFGEDGPRAGEPGMDIIAQAVSGIMSITGTSTSGPLKTGPPVADFAAALFATSGILSAVVARLSGGSGCKVSVNLLDASLAILSNFVPQVTTTGQDLMPSGSGHPQLVPYQAFRAADGRYFIVGVLTEKFWHLLRDALRNDPRLEGPGYATNSARVQNRATVTTTLQEIFDEQPQAHWVRALSDAGVPVAPVNSILEALNDPQVVFNSTALSFESTDPAHFGKYTTIRNPILIDGKPLPVRSGAAIACRLPSTGPEEGDY